MATVNVATVLRHILAILVLPTVVVAVVPHWLLSSMTTTDTRWSVVSPFGWIPMVVGGALFLGGLAMFGWCVSLFVSVGKGTLAPWDPAVTLVAVGPYRHVRNPMISSVATMLLGLATIWGSVVLGLWAFAFLLVNHVYFLASEEPGLRRRFGEKYLTYEKNVPRWIPRRNPWAG